MSVPSAGTPAMPPPQLQGESPLITLRSVTGMTALESQPSGMPRNAVRAMDRIRVVMVMTGWANGASGLFVNRYFAVVSTVTSQKVSAARPFLP